MRKDTFFNSTDKKPPPKNQANLRTGYTTGACSAAAARAATRMLLSETPADRFPDRIESVLPNGQSVVFPLKRRERDGDAAVCSIIKDGGDDPDCTHLAELIARVELSDSPGVEIRGGVGVATVTLPGLGLEVGQPSITGMPRKNITEMVQAELDGAAADGSGAGVAGDFKKAAGAIVTIEVPDGEERAKQTTNERLGLIGGISILGTTGIVKPYSTGAFRTSVVQAIDVAARRGLKEVVLTTGGKSEEYAMRENPHLGTDAFVQVGDFIGTGVKHAKRRGIPRTTIFGMMGKLSKMADGVTQTHQAGSQVNMEMLAELAKSLGAVDSVLEEIRAAKTARRVLELAVEHGWPQIAGLICERVAHVMTNYANGRAKTELTQPPESIDEEFEIVCCMTDFDGVMLGQYPLAENVRPV
ncbi:MAG: cobalt-precorrin-5B (C(1))-methyltransferase [bacterium]|nr:cobalt-precorrin-5B (C(1))-methyltransferase [bacterium]